MAGRIPVFSWKHKKKKQIRTARYATVRAECLCSRRCGGRAVQHMAGAPPAGDAGSSPQCRCIACIILKQKILRILQEILICIKCWRNFHNRVCIFSNTQLRVEPENLPFGATWKKMEESAAHHWLSKSSQNNPYKLFSKHFGHDGPHWQISVFDP